jgi:hypothetical protein
MPKRQVFYSFHYDNDSWRVWQVRNMGALEGNEPASPNAWEEVKRKGDTSIQNWIDSNMKYRSCVIVLTGSKTADRKWIDYEIKHAWSEGKGLVAIHIHGLKDVLGKQDSKGRNPFSKFYIDKTFNYIAKADHAADGNEINLSSVVKCYDTPYVSSEYVYDYIKENIADWIEEAIQIRNKYPK